MYNYATICSFILLLPNWIIVKVFFFFYHYKQCCNNILEHILLHTSLVSLKTVSRNCYIESISIFSFTRRCPLHFQSDADLETVSSFHSLSSANLVLCQLFTVADLSVSGRFIYCVCCYPTVNSHVIMSISCLIHGVLFDEAKEMNDL